MNEGALFSAFYGLRRCNWSCGSGFSGGSLFVKAVFSRRRTEEISERNIDDFNCSGVLAFLQLFDSRLAHQHDGSRITQHPLGPTEKPSCITKGLTMDRIVGSNRISSWTEAAMLCRDCGNKG